MRHRSAEVLFGNIFVRHRLDHIRPGDEHVRSIARHENKIGDRGGIHGAAGARPHDGADLRNHAAGQRVAQKNIGVTRKRSHAFLNARAARIVQPNHRRAIAHGQIHDLANFQGVGFRERPTEHSEILGKNVCQAPGDAPVAGNKPVTGRPLFLHAKILRAVHHEFVQLFKRAFVQQQRHAFACRKFSGFVLALAPFRAASGFGFRAAAAKFRDRVIRFAVVVHGKGSLHAIVPRGLGNFRTRPERRATKF